MAMFPVIVETPFMFRCADPDQRIVGQLRNITYARLALADCIKRNETPYASHLLLTQPHVLNDDDEHEREKGIQAGLDFGALAHKTVVYCDLGISTGMQSGIERAKSAPRPVEMRKLASWENSIDYDPYSFLLKLKLFTSAQLDMLIKNQKNGLGAFGLM